jgi:DNA-directed RNA polymerase I, II, and III subunit RPABC2
MSDNEEDYNESEGGSESGSESGSDYGEQETPKPFIKSIGATEVGDVANDDEEQEEEEEEAEDESEVEDDDEFDDDEEDNNDDVSLSLEEEKNKQEKPGKKNEKQKKDKNEKKAELKRGDDDSENDDDETDENYLQKFDIDINKNYLVDVHPECLHHNYDEIEALTVIVRDSNCIIIDPLHRTVPFLTKYERARVLGQRAKQINMGAQAFVKVPDNVIDGIVIAELELKEKKIPFIIKRPLPNGACEYWNIKDLENILY